MNHLRFRGFSIKFLNKMPSPYEGKKRYSLGSKRELPALLSLLLSLFLPPFLIKASLLDLLRFPKK